MLRGPAAKYNLTENNHYIVPGYQVAPTVRLRANRNNKTRAVLIEQAHLETEFPGVFNDFVSALAQMQYYLTLVWNALAAGTIPWSDYIRATDLVATRLLNVRPTLLAMYNIITERTYNTEVHGYGYTRRYYDRIRQLPPTFLDWNTIRNRQQSEFDMQSIINYEEHMQRRWPWHATNRSPLALLLESSSVVEGYAAELAGVFYRMVSIQASMRPVLHELFFYDPQNKTDPLFMVDQMIDVIQDARHYKEEGARAAAAAAARPAPPVAVRRDRPDDETDDDDPFAMPVPVRRQPTPEAVRRRDAAMLDAEAWALLMDHEADELDRQRAPRLVVPRNANQEDDDMEMLVRPMG